jgi:DNA mismatch repair ATPase MutS
VEANNWKKLFGQEAGAWFESIHRFETLNSLAGFSFANPNFTYPEMKEGSYTIDGKNIGHPLVPDHKRVCNDFLLQGKGNIVVVTGSNMSGKSTFLRTIGINSVLCKIGAPVCATEMKSSGFKIFTSMRTHDNLEENISSFYAELKRIGFLLNYISDGSPVLFLLDEILKGTNSVDRHKGAEALIMQLSQLNSFGLVSTHDLELGKLDDSNLIKNYSFNSQIQGDEILFDYKLQKGLCYSFNASKLMESIGIKIT